ncbi:ribosomal protein L32a [Acidianus hospitalis W1]|uniref:Large ribosomal subunit protein eL32 n=1 Tax=Acidianus hospitalis (strain W1) TaxID=933801 RepID=F4B8E8_ACIHW|nr:50S ribosomal protein L32e [Acidianus hospitalis]AEE93747.1 ribosomal protein L32a [Acidianus hospitalis W1]
MSINKLSKDKIYKLKQKYNSKMPDFLRYDWDKYFKLERQEKWRKTRGIDNKTRLKLKGFPPPVDPGYRKPKIIRYLHPSGLKPVIINNMKDLENIAKFKDQVIGIISSNVGFKKRLEIIKKAIEMGIKLANGE